MTTVGENQAEGGAGEAVRGFGWGQGMEGGGEAAQEGERMASRASWGRMRKWRLASGRWRKPR